MDIGEKNLLVSRAEQLMLSSNKDQYLFEFNNIINRWNEIFCWGTPKETELFNRITTAYNCFHDNQNIQSQQFDRVSTDTNTKKQSRKFDKTALIKSKKKQIADLQGQIDHLRGKLMRAWSVDYITNINTWISQKEAAIIQLQSEIINLES